MTRNIDDNDDNYDNNIKKSNGYSIKNHNDDNFSTLMLPQKTAVYAFYFIPQNGLQNNVISYNNQTKTSTKVKQPFRVFSH